MAMWSGLTTIIYYRDYPFNSIVFLHYYLFFMVPQSIDWMQKCHYLLAKIVIFPFLKEAYNWMVQLCYFPSVLQRFPPLSRRRAAKSLT